MRASQVVRDFLEWRWTPCVALTAASLAWVGLAVLFIPNQFGPNEPGNSGAAAFASAPALPNTAFNSALTQSALTSTAAQPPRHIVPPAVPVATSNEPVIRKGFSPPIEQPAAPPPPPPPLTQAAPPPPVPSPPVNAAAVAPPTPPSEPAVAPPASPASQAPAEEGNQPAPAPQ